MQKYSNLQTTKVSFPYYQTVHLDKTNTEQWLPAVNDMKNIDPFLWKSMESIDLLLETILKISEKIITSRINISEIANNTIAVLS